MKFAVIGDIHSNKYALESVLENIKQQNVDVIISTGDLVGYLPYPNEVISMIRDHHVLVVKGNHDDAIAQASYISEEEIKKHNIEKVQANASFLYTNHVISHENRLFLKNLPSELSFSILGKKVQIVHGSHRSISEYLYEDEADLHEVAQTVQADVLICGHTHIPYHKKVANVDFINVGSVGKPKTGDELATYTIVEVNEFNVMTQLVKVSYDLNQLITDIELNSMISNDLILMLKKGY